MPGFLCFITFLSQAQTNTYRLRTGQDIALVSGSGLLLGTGLFLQHNTPPLTEPEILKLDRQSINRFDRPATKYWNPGIAKVSDGVAAGSVLMYSYFFFKPETRKDAFKIGFVGFESVLLSQALANIIKPVNRIRPFVYNPDAPMEKKLKADARMSFFSAHTSTVSAACFSFAAAHSYYMPGNKNNRYIWAGAFVVPAVQGYLRVRAGKHYPSDVIAGYLVGLGTSLLMHHLHKQ